MKISSLVRSLTLLSLVFLFGCVTNKEVRVIESQKLVMLDLDPKYLKDCNLETPPDVLEYLSLGMDGREDSVTRTLGTQYKHQKECLLDKRSLRLLIEKQKKAIEAYNAKEVERVNEQKIKMELDDD